MQFIYTPPFAARRNILQYSCSSLVLFAIAFFIGYTHLKHQYKRHYKLSTFYNQNTTTSSTTTKPIEKENETLLPLTGTKTHQSNNKPDKIIISNKHFFVKANDSLNALLLRAGVDKPSIAKIIQNKTYKKHQVILMPGSKIDFFYENKRIKKIRIPLTITKFLHIIFTEKNVILEYETKPINKKLTYVHNYIKGSLYNSARKAGLSTKTIMQLAEIFSCDIDFALDIRENDYFKILYEEEFVENKKLDSGHIVAAEFYTQGQLYRAIRFQDSNGNVDYYSPEGFSVKKTFLRTPVKFTHISSHFNPFRKHPILHHIRAHNGVDYAAPHGTPVKAAGHGKVTFIGFRGGYGKAIEIQHGNKYSTFYAHLSRYSKIKLGQKIKQGEVIGYVGNTGLASGSHLHYEFRINGIHHNPITTPMPRQKLQLSKQQKAKFNALAKSMLLKLSTNNKYPALRTRHNYEY